MTAELQSLLNKINTDGIQKAESERKNIITAARKEADDIIAAAKNQRDAIIAEAEKEAEAIKNRAVSGAAQAARDITLELRDALAQRLENAVAGATAQALSPEFMASLISGLAKTFAESPDSQITVRCAVKDREALDAALKNALAESFKNAPKLIAAPEIANGIEVDFKDGKCFFDFTAEAVTDLFKEYIGEQLAVIFKAE